ncbi:hypothetical protein B0H14DRAFT_2560988 [Mycena olivaceomarginata]|nr:hypothetical protein B0H14DRAFT_2560988 [Mycena olivaceomarginata]
MSEVDACNKQYQDKRTGAELTLPRNLILGLMSRYTKMTVRRVGPRPLGFPGDTETVVTWGIARIQGQISPKSLRWRCSLLFYVWLGAFLPVLPRSAPPWLVVLLSDGIAERVKDLFGYSPDLSHPLLRSITHLDIRDMGGEFDFARVFPQIPTLLALTYLALRFEVPRDNVLSLLAQCPPLKLLLLWPRSCTAGVQPVGLRHWEAGAKGFPDCWAEGDTFVARERNGLTEPTRYWLTED